MLDYGLSNQQLTVIGALSTGATMTAAAELAGVHRNTVNNWRRNSLPFQQALADAQYDRALFFREKIEGLADAAFQTIHDLLADPKTPAGIRLKAALAIIQTASTAPLPKKQVQLDLEKIVVKRTPAAVISEDQLKPAPPAHMDAQSAPPAAASSPVSSQAVNNSAQQPYRRESPKIGRNDACPCGSGLKYKRCCIDKTLPHAA